MSTKTSFIGSVLWFTIAGTTERGEDGSSKTVPVRSNHDMLTGWFEELKLDTEFLPPPIRKVDAFRNATTATVIEYDHEGILYKLFSVESKSDGDQVIREIRRFPSTLAEGDHVGTMQFIRGGRTSTGKRNYNDRWKFVILSKIRGAHREAVESFIAAMTENYDDLANNLRSPAIRKFLRDYLASLNAIQVKETGGVYFVHASRQKSVDALQELIRRVGQSCSFYQFPLIDNDASRTMLAEAFSEDVEDKCHLLQVDITNLLSGLGDIGSVTPRKYGEIDKRYNEISERCVEYGDLLNLPQEKAHAALETALADVVTLHKRINYSRRTRA